MKEAFTLLKTDVENCLRYSRILGTETREAGPKTYRKSLPFKSSKWQPGEIPWSIKNVSRCT